MEYPGALAVARPSGAILIDGHHAADTVACAHCGGHFVMVRGSGKIRGWCTRCRAMTCGAPACDVCVPYEQRLEQEEAAYGAIRHD